MYRGERLRDAGADGSFERLFRNHDGKLIDKWHHYLPLYDRYFGHLKGSAVRVLEIGVSGVGSLEIWRSFFGPDATLYGIDIDPACARYDRLHGQVWIGSQDDPDFMRKVVDEMGGADLVIDDGSHITEHIRASLNVPFALVSEDGLYWIEDLHATYWASRDGGYQDESTVINDFRQMYDDMHHWYHQMPQQVGATADTLAGIHLHDSVAVLEKATVSLPQRTMLEHQ